MSQFVEWESFYLIVGSAAGALIGLQFVVITLIAERPPPLRWVPRLPLRLSSISASCCFFQQFYALHGTPLPPSRLSGVSWA